jgi:hypothetical protein
MTVQSNARIEKTAQAVECLMDIRFTSHGSSGILVFDSEQPGGGNGHESESRSGAVGYLRELPQTATLSSFVITSRRSNVFTPNS